MSDSETAPAAAPPAAAAAAAAPAPMTAEEKLAARYGGKLPKKNEHLLAKIQKPQGGRQFFDSGDWVTGKETAKDIATPGKIHHPARKQHSNLAE